MDAPALARRFKKVAFSVSATLEQGERIKGQLTSCARRLAALVAEPDAPVPGDVAAAVEEALGRLLEALDTGADRDRPRA